MTADLIARLRVVCAEMESHCIGPNVDKHSIFHDCLAALERDRKALCSAETFLRSVTWHDRTSETDAGDLLEELRVAWPGANPKEGRMAEPKHHKMDTAEREQERKDAERMNALATETVIVVNARADGWAARLSNKSGHRRESWHLAPTMREAIDAAMAGGEPQGGANG